jgi:hypothetical protein
MTRDELIAALERASEGNRNLDFWCWWYGRSSEASKAAPQPPPADYVESNLSASLRAHADARANAFSPTHSLDAALRLIPPGARLRELGQRDDNGTQAGWFCTILRWEQIDGVWGERAFEAFELAPTPALAVCIAALRSHAATAQPEPEDVP